MSDYGVTDELIADADATALVLDSGDRIIFSANVGPAVAQVVAEQRLGAPVEFAGLNILRQPVYAKART